MAEKDVFYREYFMQLRKECDTIRCEMNRFLYFSIFVLGGVGFAPAGQIPLLRARLRQGIPIAVEPLVRAHDEDADQRLADDPIVDALEPVVEPAQVVSRQINQGLRSEVAFPDGARGLGRVPPRAQDQFLMGVPVRDHAQIVEL